MLKTAVYRLTSSATYQKPQNSKTRKCSAKPSENGNAEIAGLDIAGLDIDGRLHRGRYCRTGR